VDLLDLRTVCGEIGIPVGDGRGIGEEPQFADGELGEAIGRPGICQPE